MIFFITDGGVMGTFRSLRQTLDIYNNRNKKQEETIWSIVDYVFKTNSINSFSTVQSFGEL